MPRSGGEVEFARVVKRLRDKDGLPIGTANDNPILDTRLYEVEFPDGHTTSLAANVIAENLFSQVDPEGNRLALLDDIIDYRTDVSNSLLMMPHLSRRRGRLDIRNLRLDGKCCYNGRMARLRGLP
jgi:hypothetical protein